MMKRKRGGLKDSHIYLATSNVVYHTTIASALTSFKPASSRSSVSSNPQSPQCILLIKNDIRDLPCNLEPRDRLPDQPCHDVPLQYHNFAAQLQTYPNQIPDSVRGEVSRKATVCGSQLYERKGPVIVEGEGGDTVGEDVCRIGWIWVWKAERGVVAIADDKEAIVGLSRDYQSV